MADNSEAEALSGIYAVIAKYGSGLWPDDLKALQAAAAVLTKLESRNHF